MWPADATLFIFWRTCFLIRLLDGKIMFEYTWRSQNVRRLKTLINKFNSRTVKARKPFYCSKECVTGNLPFSRIAFDWTGQYFLPYNRFRGRHETCAYFLFFFLNFLTNIVSRYICEKRASRPSAFLYILVIDHKNTSIRSLTRLKNLTSLKSTKTKILQQ